MIAEQLYEDDEVSWFQNPSNFYPQTFIYPKFFWQFDQTAVCSKKNLHFTVWRIIGKAHKTAQGAEVQQDYHGCALTLLLKRKTWELLRCRI